MLAMGTLKRLLLAARTVTALSGIWMCRRYALKPRPCKLFTCCICRSLACPATRITGECLRWKCVFAHTSAVAILVAVFLAGSLAGCAQHTAKAVVASHPHPPHILHAATPQQIAKIEGRCRGCVHETGGGEPSLHALVRQSEFIDVARVTFGKLTKHNVCYRLSVDTVLKGAQVPRRACTPIYLKVGAEYIIFGYLWKGHSHVSCGLPVVNKYVPRFGDVRKVIVIRNCKGLGESAVGGWPVLWNSKPAHVKVQYAEQLHGTAYKVYVFSYYTYNEVISYIKTVAGTLEQERNSDGR